MYLRLLLKIPAFSASSRSYANDFAGVILKRDSSQLLFSIVLISILELL